MLVALLVGFGMMGPGLYSLDRSLPFALPRPHTFIAALAITLVIVGLVLVPTMSAPAAGR